MKFRVHSSSKKWLSEIEEYLLKACCRIGFRWRGFKWSKIGVEHVTDPQNQHIEDIYGFRKVRILKTSVVCCLNRRLWELVRLVRPPVARRPASFRLCFRFVRVVPAVRACETKLRGRMTIDVLIAGLPRCEYPGVCARTSASS